MNFYKIKVPNPWVLKQIWSVWSKNDVVLKFKNRVNYYVLGFRASLESISKVTKKLNVGSLECWEISKKKNALRRIKWFLCRRWTTRSTRRAWSESLSLPNALSSWTRLSNCSWTQPPRSRPRSDQPATSRTPPPAQSRLLQSLTARTRSQNKSESWPRWPGRESTRPARSKRLHRCSSTRPTLNEFLLSLYWLHLTLLYTTYYPSSLQEYVDKNKFMCTKFLCWQ